MSLHVRIGGVYKDVLIDNLFRRVDGVYAKYNELYVKNAGGHKSVWREDKPPPAPTGVFTTWDNGGVINVFWTWAANSDNDYNRVEVQEVGDVGRIATGYPETSQVRTGYAHGQVVNLQVRTIDDGGHTSDWVTVPAVTTVVAYPGIATMTGIGWNGTAFVVNWTDGDNTYGELMHARLMCKTSAEGSYTQVVDVEASAGAPHSVIAPVRAWDANHIFYIETWTQWWEPQQVITNSQPMSRWAPPQPGTEKTINAFSADSYAYTPQAWLSDGRARQGQFSPTPMGLHFGMFFYDDLLYNASHGHPAVSGDIFMIRDGEQGFPGTVFFAGHGYRSRPAGAPTGSGVTWPSTQQFAGADYSAYEALPTSFLQSVAAGTTKGVGMFTFSDVQTNYKVFKGPSMNGQAGMIRLRW